MNIGLLITLIMTVVFYLIGLVWFWYHVIKLIVRFVKFIIKKAKKEDNQPPTV